LVNKIVYIYAILTSELVVNSGGKKTKNWSKISTPVDNFLPGQDQGYRWANFHRLVAQTLDTIALQASLGVV